MLLRLYKLIWIAAILLMCCHASVAQYVVAPLCKAAGRFNDSTPRCVVQLSVPPNTVRLLYSISTDEQVSPPYAGLDSQVNAMLPQKPGWLGIATIAEKIKGTTGNGTTSVYFYNNRRCIDKFASYKKKNCKARWQLDNCKGGTFDIPWQATLFTEKYYLCLLNPYRYTPRYFTIEVVAIVAE